MTPTATAQAAIHDLIEAIGWLAASLLPGTAKPYRAPAVSAEKLLKRALEDRAYRLLAIIGNTIPLGESPAPHDLTIMDLLAECMTVADSLADLVSDTAVVARMPEARSAFTDPVPYLLHVIDLLPACRHVPEVARRVTETCHDLRERAYQPLGLVMDGQLLATECPWCGGRTSTHPTGGARTMRVRLLPSTNPQTGEPDEMPAIVCEGGACQPPDSDVGNWYRQRHPAWIQAEWDWLAGRIERSAVA